MALAVDSANNVFIVGYPELGQAGIRKVSSGGVISTLVRSSTAGFSGDGGRALDAQLSGPGAIAVDGAGNLFIADADNKRIRKVSRDGVITTVAGTGDRENIGADGARFEGWAI
jgi:hypothetical protein